MGCQGGYRRKFVLMRAVDRKRSTELKQVCVRSRWVSGLQLVESVVKSFLGHQLSVAALFHNSAVM